MIRVLDGLFALAFVTSAAVQLNDPDPIRWVVLYVLAAVGCAAPRHARWGLGIAVVVGITALVASVLVIPEATRVTGVGDVVAAMSPDRPETEAARELGGLMLIVAWASIRATGARDSR